VWPVKANAVGLSSVLHIRQRISQLLHRTVRITERKKLSSVKRRYSYLEQVWYLTTCLQRSNKTNHNNCVGPPYFRTEIYAICVSYAADDAHRPQLPGFLAAARAAPETDRQTDGRTGGHGSIFIMFTAYAVRVITTNK